MCSDNPFALEDQGEYDAAAVAYAQRGFEKLLTSHFEPDGTSRIGLGMLLQSMNCDCRIGNRRRATHIFDIVKLLLRELRDQTDDTVLMGLTHEWAGDGLLTLHRIEAVEQYCQALEYYDDLSWEDETWREEPDFAHAYWAIQRFSQFYTDPGLESQLSLSFEERIDQKIIFPKDLIE